MRWFYAILGGILGALLFDFSGFIGGLAVGWLVSHFHKSGSRAPAPPPLPKRTPNESQSERRTVSAQTAHRPPPLSWLPLHSAINHGGVIIPGMVYVSNEAPNWDSEPSTIYIKQRVGRPVVSTGRELPYYPSYANLTEDQRATYLHWLASGRREVGSAAPETGYIFLFFYGIERRVLIDGDQSDDLLDEVFEILRHHGGPGASRSLLSYLGDFLHFTTYRRGEEKYRGARDALLDVCGDHAGELALSLALANLYERGEAVDAGLALRLARGHDGSKRSVVVKRTGATFVEAFRRRFEARYPQGLALRAGKHPLKVNYRPANASLLRQFATHSGWPESFTLRVPNVYGLKAQFKDLPQIWNECIDDLSGFSRALVRVRRQADSSAADLMKAYLALPDDVRPAHLHPLADKMDDLLETFPKENGRTFVPVKALAEMIELPERPTFTAAHSRKIAELVASFGYGIAPDPRILGLPLGLDEEVALVATPLETKHDPQTLGLLRLLYLSVAIAAADGTVDEDEMKGFHETLEGRIHDLRLRELFAATEAALLRDTRVAVRHAGRIAKSVKPVNRAAVYRLLVHVAGADDVITSDERRSLLKIARAFELPATLLDDILEEDREFPTVTVSRSASLVRGEPIPGAPETAPGFALDMDRIASIAEETEKVVGILAEALSEEDETEDAEPETKEGCSEGVPEWMESLDSDFAPALRDLLRDESAVSAARMHEVAARHHLMPTALIDTVNAWADEELGDFLLEDRGDEGITIYRELIPEPAHPS